MDARERVDGGGDLEPLEAREQRFEHDPRFEAGEICAEAEVRAAGAERHVVVRVRG